MLRDWIAWLWKKAPDEPHPEKVERLVSGLRSADRDVRRRADYLISRIFIDTSDYDSSFLVLLLDTLGREGNPENLDFVVRYVSLLAEAPGMRHGDPVQSAARDCVALWNARQAERAEADTLLRASRSPDNIETLLRPALGNPEVVPDELLRPDDRAHRNGDEQGK